MTPVAHRLAIPKLTYHRVWANVDKSMETAENCRSRSEPERCYMLTNLFKGSDGA